MAVIHHDVERRPARTIPTPIPRAYVKLVDQNAEGVEHWRGWVEITDGGYAPIDPLVLTGDVLASTGLVWRRMPANEEPTP